MPEAVEFPPTWVGASSTVQVEIANRGKTQRTASLRRVDLPFTASTPTAVPPGETALLQVHFTPTTEGDSSGTLVLLDESMQLERTVSLSATAKRPPECPPPTACDEHHFDFSRGECVKTLASDGSSCTSTFACFRSAVCLAGECRGQAVTCDDGLRCTLDLCGPLGCGSVSMLSVCPEPPNPCEASACTEALGCTTEPLPDGTRCGPRTCTSARVCISGSCVTRVPPKGQACADVLVGVPAGPGHGDGVGTEVRLGARSIALDGNTAYIGDNGTVRRVSSRGEVTTILGKPLQGAGWVIRDGVGSTAGLGPFPQIAPTGIPGKLLLLDFGELRLVGTQGSVVTLVPAVGMTPIDGVGRAANMGNASGLVFASTGTVQFTTTNADSCGPSAPFGCMDGGVVRLRSATVTGEVRTLAQTHLDWPPSDIFSWVPRPNEVCVLLADHLPPFEKRFVLSDGGLIETSTGCPTREWPGVTLNQGRLRIGAENLAMLDVADGPIADAGAGWVVGADVASDGTIWFLDEVGESNFRSSRVRVVENGVVRTLAGPFPDVRVVDGAPDAGRLSRPEGLSLAGDSLYFTDLAVNGGFVRVLSLADLSLRTIGVPSRANPPRDGAADAGSFLMPTRTALHDGGLYVLDESFVRRVELDDFEISTVLRTWTTTSWPWRSNEGALWGVGSFGLSTIDLNDGGLSAAVGALDVTEFDTVGPGVFVASVASLGGSAPTQLYEVTVADGGARLLAGRPEDEGRDFLPGLAGVARLGWIRHVRAAPNGAVYWSQNGENAINVLTPAGEVRRVIELADRPVDFVVEPNGTLLVAVASAILRVQP